jgi:transmembrane sensor
MTNPALEPERIDRARDALARRAEEVVALPSIDDVHARVGQRRRRRAVAGAAAAVAVLALGALAASRLGAPAASSAPSHEVAREAPGAPAAPPAAEREPVMRFSDGTRVWSLAPDSAPDAAPADSGCCHLEEASDERVVVRLGGGGARFEVTPDRTRDFVVRAGGVTVQVIGTGFEVERRGGEVEVNVLHGVVSVTAAEGAPVRLERGERATFSDAEVAAVAPEPEVVPAPEPASRKRAKETPPRAPRPKGDGWRTRAAAGDYDAAAELLASSPDLSDVGDLFLAADAMRLTRNHDEAIGYLDRILSEHPGDERAPLAALTRGRILDRRMGDPCAAAASFARATELGARGSLGRDALIREAESWRACGEEDRARDALERFIARYPEHRERADRLLEGAP